jgi:hypothetical protein
MALIARNDVSVSTEAHHASNHERDDIVSAYKSRLEAYRACDQERDEFVAV